MDRISLVKTEALERASCQRGLAGRRLTGWPLLQLYTTTPRETHSSMKEVVRATSRAKAWLGSTNRRGRSSGSPPIGTRIREDGEISGAQSPSSGVILTSQYEVAAGIAEGGRAPMTSRPHQRVRVSSVVVFAPGCL